MSSQSDDQGDLVLSYTIGNACGYAVLTLLTCEWLFTFRSEIALFWRRTLSGPTVLFILNRYITLVNAYFGAFAFSSTVQRLLMSEQGCTAIIQTGYTINFLQFLPAAVFSTLRVHALARSWLISILTFVLSNAPTVVNFVTTFGMQQATGSPDPAFGCVEVTNNVPDYWDEASILIARLSVILADIIVLLVTWFATYRKGLIKYESRQPSLLFVVLYNGTCYFSIMLIFNVLHIALSFASVGYNSNSFASNVTAFTQPITNLIARFLIDLQATNRATMDIDGPGTGTGLGSQRSNRISDVDTLRFEAVIGSIGTVLTGGSDVDADDIIEDQHCEDCPLEAHPVPSQQSNPQAIPGDEA